MSTRSVPSAGLRANVLFVAAALAAGAGVGLSGFSRTGILLLGLAIILVLPVVQRVIAGRLDLFEPIIVVTLALTVMFLIRPAALLIADRQSHLGYDIMGTFDRTITLAIIAAGCFQLGYFTRMGPRFAARLPAPPMELRPKRAALFALLLSGVGLGLYGLFLVQSGGTSALLSFLSGRQPEQNDLYLGSTAYLYYGRLLLAPALLIMVATYRERRKWRYLAIGFLLAMVLLVLAGATGSRLVLLILLVPPLIWRYLRRGRRPNILVVLLGGFLVLTIGIGFLRESRTGTQGLRGRLEVLGQVMSKPSDEVERLLLGADTNMFDSVAIEISTVPGKVPFQHGALVRDLFVRSVPRVFWRNKPPESNEVLVTALWPRRYLESRASPAFSVIGALWLDSGYLTLLPGMFLFGILFSSLWSYWNLYRNAAAGILYAMSLPLMVVFLRGNPSGTLARGLFTVVPILILWKAAGRGAAVAANHRFTRSSGTSRR